MSPAYEQSSYSLTFLSDFSFTSFPPVFFSFDTSAVALEILVDLLEDGVGSLTDLGGISERV
jgi:hypothetical protein